MIMAEQSHQGSFAGIESLQRQGEQALSRLSDLAQSLRSDHVNVGQAERTISAVAGGALALAGLSRGSLGGLALAALGGGLVYRGVTGHCAIKEKLQNDGGLSKFGLGGGSKHEAKPSDYFKHGGREFNEETSTVTGARIDY